MIVAFGLAACGGDEEYASIKELADTRDMFLETLTVTTDYEGKEESEISGSVGDSVKGSAPCTVITTGTSYLYCDWSGGSISYRGQHEGSAENGAETGSRSKLCKKRKYEAGNPAGHVPVQ